MYICASLASVCLCARARVQMIMWHISYVPQASNYPLLSILMLLVWSDK